METETHYSPLTRDCDELELVNNASSNNLNEEGGTDTDNETVRPTQKSTSPYTSSEQHSVNIHSKQKSLISPKKKINVKQSKRLPYWLWYLIAKSLGIKLSPQEKPILATLLFILTLASAGGFVLSNTYFSALNIVSVRTRDDVLDGTVSVLVVGFWCALGIYSNKLAYRLFGHHKFLAMLRLHSKTVFKLNAAFVVFFLWTAFVVLHNMSTMHYWVGTPCSTIGLADTLCKTIYCCQVVFSIFTLMWNVLVAVVLVSVCRTHTIGIRKLILELEQDAIACSLQGNETPKDLGCDHEWIDENYYEELMESSDDATHASEQLSSRDHVTDNVERCVPPLQSQELKPECSQPNNPISPDEKPVCMSNADILHKYWNIMVKLRVSSLALQRWMVSVVSLTVVWATINMVNWLTQPPELYEVLNFLMPLLLLPLLCSAYAEVNNEGRQVLKCIRPCERRLMMLQYLQHIPLELTVLNHAVTYSTIGTAALGLLLAIVSKILLRELV